MLVMSLQMRLAMHMHVSSHEPVAIRCGIWQVLFAHDEWHENMMNRLFCANIQALQCRMQHVQSTL